LPQVTERRLTGGRRAWILGWEAQATLTSEPSDAIATEVAATVGAARSLCAGAFAARRVFAARGRSRKAVDVVPDAGLPGCFWLAVRLFADRTDRDPAVFVVVRKRRDAGEPGKVRSGQVVSCGRARMAHLLSIAPLAEAAVCQQREMDGTPAISLSQRALRPCQKAATQVSTKARSHWLFVPSCACRAQGSLTTSRRISVMSSMAKRTPSRPRPESLTPP
jgi:hypothetical protein